jgi:hypothetical protein
MKKTSCEVLNETGAIPFGHSSQIIAGINYKLLNHAPQLHKDESEFQIKSSLIRECTKLLSFLVGL